MHVGMMADARTKKGRNEVCIAYEPPAESPPGDDGVISICKNN